MVRKDEAIKLSVMMNKKNIGPILILQDLAQPAFLVPLRRLVRRPFDCGAVGLETGIADIGFGR